MYIIYDLDRYTMYPHIMTLNNMMIKNPNMLVNKC